MKTLYLIGGTMGVGKTAVSRELKKILPNAVMLDGFLDTCKIDTTHLTPGETARLIAKK